MERTFIYYYYLKIVLLSLFKKKIVTIIILYKCVPLGRDNPNATKKVIITRTARIITIKLRVCVRAYSLLFC